MSHPSVELSFLMWKNPVYNSFYYLKICIPEQEGFKIFISITLWRVRLICNIVMHHNRYLLIHWNFHEYRDNPEYGRWNVGCKSVLAQAQRKDCLLKGIRVTQSCKLLWAVYRHRMPVLWQIEIYCQHSNLFPQQNSIFHPNIHPSTQQRTQSIQDNIHWSLNRQIHDLLIRRSMDLLMKHLK